MSIQCTSAKARWRSREAVVVSLAALAVVAGCGGSKDKDKSSAKATDESSIRNVISQLQQASVAGDGDRICNEIFTPKLANSVTKSSRSGSCAKEVRRNLFSPKTRLTVEDVKVADAGNATATVREANGNTSAVFFIRQAGVWRIRGLRPA